MSSFFPIRAEYRGQVGRAEVKWVCPHMEKGRGSCGGHPQYDVGAGIERPKKLFTHAHILIDA